MRFPSASKATNAYVTEPCVLALAEDCPRTAQICKIFLTNSLYHDNETNMSSKIEKMQKQLDEVKSLLQDFDVIRPGSVSKQQRKARGKVYGGYCYLSYTFNGESFTEYVPKKHLGRIKDEVHAYKKFKRLIDRYVSISIKISRELTKT